MADEKSNKAILLIFIHGFKGGDGTFARFPTGISHALKAQLGGDVDVLPMVYPAFETKGSLVATVERFRAWLLEKVIDAEIARGTTSPTVDPHVGVIIVGHSMGGIVGAEAILGTARECFQVEASDPKQEYDTVNVPTSFEHAVPVEEAAQIPVPEEAPMDEGKEGGDATQTTDEAQEEVKEETAARKQAQEDANVNVKGKLFPRFLGLLAFDTPFLGIAPGVVKHNAEDQFQQGKAWYDSASTLFAAGSTVSNVFGLGGKEKEKMAAAKAAENQAKKTGWGRTALLAGAGITALAGTAGAAYYGRDQIAGSFNWAGSHLEFVGCLARDAELKKRFGDMAALTQPEEVAKDTESTTKPREETLGFKVLYTCLAPVLGGDTAFTGGRTFCRVPQEPVEWQTYWSRARNDKVKNEIEAHQSMFEAKQNPQYDSMVEESAGLTSEWVKRWD
ncbi:MAG: hypothetical protein Q9162_000888 [Coniocarpon cinnabarinum]